MSLEEAKALLLPIHACLGILALIVGFVAVFARKRRGRHTSLGAAFVILMLLAIMASAPVIVLSGNLFLGGLGAVALYLVLVGWRIGKLRPPAQQATLLDRGFVLLSLTLFVLFMLFGLRYVLQGQMVALVAIAIGYLGAKSAWDHHCFFRDPEGGERSWMQHHGGTLGGALIASVTALCAAVLTNYLPQVPEFIVWLVPIVLLIPMIRKQVARGRS
jgi:hypothetical protein